MKRRNFLGRTTLGLLGLGAMAGLYAWQIEPFWLEFVRHKMPIKNLPKALAGKTLMQISDIHVGNRFDYQYIIDSFKKAQKLAPDFVAYTGDYISYENGKQITQLKEVMDHAVTGTLGTVAILGNHDYGHNWAQEEVAQEVISVLEESGVIVLRNQNIEVNGMHFIGIDDYWAINFAPQQAFEAYDATVASVALCHNPDVCDLDVWQGYQGWILSGHTHGGQCKPPFLQAPILPVKNKRYDAGKIDLNDGRQLYINRALGHLWQMRFNVRPEITVFTMERA